MALARIYTRAKVGLEAPLVVVEVHIRLGGLPSFTIVGLPETAVKESKHRVKSALQNSKFKFPRGVVTVNLAPADIPKEGGAFDLPIAIGILKASKQLDEKKSTSLEWIGELGLDGELRAVKSVLPLACQTNRAKRCLVLPKQNAQEASLVHGLKLAPFRHLLELCAWLENDHIVAPTIPNQPRSLTTQSGSLNEVIGQGHGKRALMIAAAGNHNLIFEGPPGTGKTLLAKCLPSLLPKLDQDAALEVATIASVSAEGFDLNTWGKRPFRTPHHTASHVAMVGGGAKPKPGEISLAHHGVLFLDELPEFGRQVLETLRQPMEEGRITINRAQQTVHYPARFQLIAAMNPCPCGHLGDSQIACHCSSQKIDHYRHKLSGPLLDRVDIQVKLARPPISDLFAKVEDSKKDRSSETTCSAFHASLRRQEKPNALLSSVELKRWAPLCKGSERLLSEACKKYQISFRGAHRIIRVARTIADLDQSENIVPASIAEALSLRQALNQRRGAL